MPSKEKATMEVLERVQFCPVGILSSTLDMLQLEDPSTVRSTKIVNEPSEHDEQSAEVSSNDSCYNSFISDVASLSLESVGSDKSFTDGSKTIDELLRFRGPEKGLAPTGHLQDCALPHKSCTAGSEYIPSVGQKPPAKYMKPDQSVYQPVPWQPTIEYQGVQNFPVTDERTFNFSNGPSSFSPFTARQVFISPSGENWNPNAFENSKLSSFNPRPASYGQNDANFDIFRGSQPPFTGHDSLEPLDPFSDYFPSASFEGNRNALAPPHPTYTQLVGSLNGYDRFNENANFSPKFSQAEYCNAITNSNQGIKPHESIYNGYDVTHSQHFLHYSNSPVISVNGASSLCHADLDEILEYVNSDKNHPLPKENVQFPYVCAQDPYFDCRGPKTGAGQRLHDQRVPPSPYFSNEIINSPGSSHLLNEPNRTTAEGPTKDKGEDEDIFTLMRIYAVNEQDPDIQHAFSETSDNLTSFPFPADTLYPPCQSQCRESSVRCASLSPSYLSTRWGQKSDAGSCSDYNNSPGHLSDCHSRNSSRPPSVTWPGSVSSDTSYLSPGACRRSNEKTLSEQGSPEGVSSEGVFSEEPLDEPVPDEAALDDKRIKMAHACRLAAGFTLEQLLAQDDEGDTTLHSAMIEDNWFLVEALLNRLDREGSMADIVNVENNNNQTPLCLAVIFNKPEIIETLLNHNANVNVQMRKKMGGQMGMKFYQPVHFAAKRGASWLKTLKKILDAEGVNVNSLNSDGQTPLHCAIEAHRKTLDDSKEKIDSRHVLMVLCEHGADLNKPDGSSEKTPLHYAIEKKDMDLVTKLLGLAHDSGDQRNNSVSRLLNAKTGAGNAALHLAVSITMELRDHKKLVQMLLCRGADPSCKNAEGQLPREVARNQEIVELLKGKGLGRSSMR